jgi:7,8-dihydropterin-6-yl-methyl-4-(beta-D-ribofuranosyl)aminobenzene 5'-phosphate synthase
MLTLVLMALTVTGDSPTVADPVVRITILYDNTAAVAGATADWGFACLVETPEGRVLFDTGTRPDVLLANVEALDVDISGVDAIVLSHVHDDHAGGLAAALEGRQGVRLFIPGSFPASFDGQASAAGAQVIRVSEPVEIIPGVRSTGELQGPVNEQALIVNTANGPAVVTGCAHPGIVNIARHAAEIAQRPPCLVLGGFHLLRHGRDEVDGVIAGLKGLGVTHASPGHCTGDDAIDRFRKAFGDSFTPLGVGTVIEIAD